MKKMTKNEKRTRAQAKNNWAKIARDASSITMYTLSREDATIALSKRKLTKNIKIII